MTVDRRPCPRCPEFLPGEAEMEKTLLEYVASLPEETRVDDDTYERRLRLCEACSLRVGGMCRVCGCFVRARAAKRGLSCPKPGGAEWSAAEPRER